MNNYLNDFGMRIRYYRKKQGISQEKLSELCGLHPTYIGQLERGEKNASLETIMSVANGLNISPAMLLEKVNNETEQSIPKQAYNLFLTVPFDKQQILLELLKKAKELI